MAVLFIFMLIRMISRQKEPKHRGASLGKANIEEKTCQINNIIVLYNETESNTDSPLRQICVI